MRAHRMMIGLLTEPERRPTPTASQSGRSRRGAQTAGGGKVGQQVEVEEGQQDKKGEEELSIFSSRNYPLV